MNVYHFEFEKRMHGGGWWITGIMLVLASTEIEAVSKASVKLETEGLGHKANTLRVVQVTAVPGPADVLFYTDGDY